MKNHVLRKLEKYHFLRLDDIKDKIIDMVNADLFDDAKSYLEDVIDVYILYHEEIVSANSFLVIHFEKLHLEDFQKSLKGRKYSDGSTFKFVHEINKLIKFVNKKEQKKAKKIFQSHVKSLDIFGSNYRWGSLNRVIELGWDSESEIIGNIHDQEKEVTNG
jgi:hypothetical protein